MDVKEKDLATNENLENTSYQDNIVNKENIKNENLNLVPSQDSGFIPVKKQKNTLSIFNLLIIIVFSILIICFLIFTAYNTLNNNIVSGVHIKGLDVSNMSISDAKYQLDNYINNLLPEEIKVKHGDFETTISLSQIGATFDTKSAVNTAYNVGRQGNIFQNNLQKMVNLIC